MIRLLVVYKKSQITANYIGIIQIQNVDMLNDETIAFANRIALEHKADIYNSHFEFNADDAYKFLVDLTRRYPCMIV